MGDDFMELWTCQKLITVNHTIDSVPAVIKLDSVAECGSVLAKLREDDIACIELDEHFEQSTGVGQRTRYVQIDNVNSGDVVEISYFPYADEKIGEIDDYSTTLERVHLDKWKNHVDLRYANTRLRHAVDIEFTSICVACKLYNTEISGMIIRDYGRGTMLFAVPENVPCKLHPHVIRVNDECPPHDEYIGDTITWSGGIECKYYWRTEFSKDTSDGPAIPETDIVGPTIAQRDITNIEIRSIGLERSRNKIDQSMQVVYNILVPMFKKAGVVMEYDDFVYKPDNGIPYRLKIDVHDAKWDIYVANSMEHVHFCDLSVNAMAACLPHVLPFLEKYAETLKTMESECTSVADTVKRIADSIKP